MSMPKNYPVYEETPEYEEWWNGLNKMEKKEVMQLYSPTKVVLSDYLTDDAGYGTLTYRCPHCNRLLDIWHKACPDCGQKLNWKVK